MIKKSLLKKICLAVIAIIVTMLLYSFPKKDDVKDKKIINNSICKTAIYTLDKYKYVARININTKSNNIVDLVKELVEYLTINTKNYLPINFFSIIPENTKLLNVDFKNGILKLNFSEELLNIDEEYEEKLIESLTYSLTEIENVDGIMIFINGELLTNMPKSKKYIPNVLTRSYGINKEYELNSYKKTKKVNVYYIANSDNMKYYIPVTKVMNESKEKIEIIIDELQSTPINKTNLKSYLAMNTKLINYEILEDSITLSFDDNIYTGNNDKLLEEVTYTISLSIKDTYNISNTIFRVNNKYVETKSLN